MERLENTEYDKTIVINGIECPVITIDDIDYPEIIPDVITDKPVDETE